MSSVQWFRQNPGIGLIRLFYVASGTKQEGRLKAAVYSKERYSTLHISTSQLEDSGTYLCAAGAQCSQGTCSLSPNCRCTCSHSLCLREDLASSVCTAVGVLIHILALSPLLTGDFSAPSTHLRWALFLPETLYRNDFL
ncbi:putative T-cell receptor alpha chain V region 2B4-like isoform X2 [Sciurus carolinensis]|nr:putative T-cell receptor alpha chain V region 2B4-like isoform X2 [Sciurus carolinensis]